MPGTWLNRAGYLGAGLNTYIDYKSMRSGEIGAGRFAYRTSGTLSSIFGGTAIGAQFGGPWGAVGGTLINVGFLAGEQMYDGFMYRKTQMGIFLNNFENGLKNGWVLGR
ncbi:MAG: hypothetical protein LW852_02440 [Sediminibacterium sp.]|jgi:hypothetical protein|nr:hypothetical protein [Sediminibacterium sp.]